MSSNKLNKLDELLANNSSDEDESDEDFCPEKEKAEPESDESNNTDEDVDSEDDVDSENDNKSKRNLTKKPKLLQKTNRSSRQNQDLENSKKGRLRQSNGSPEKSDKEDVVDEDPARTNNLWADFLKDVKPSAVSSKSSSQEQSINKKPSDKKDMEESKNDSLQSTDNSRENSSTENSREKVNIDKLPEKPQCKTEILDFAGEILMVEKEESGSTITKTTSLGPITKLKRSSSNLVGSNNSKSNGSGGGGLNSILNQLGKKKKLSVLEKTKMDWTTFKKTEGIDEQIQSFNKGKDGYLERQDFLQRTDVRQFEIEKNLRQSKRTH